MRKCPPHPLNVALYVRLQVIHTTRNDYVHKVKIHILVL